METRKQEAYQMQHLSMADGGMYAGHDETMQPQSDGTTILSIKYNGGILLGADSRSSNVSLSARSDGVLHNRLMQWNFALLTIFSLSLGYVHRRPCF